MAKKTHIPTAGANVTYCGLRFADGGLQVIDIRRDLVDSATCRNCQRVDDFRQVRDYQRECREGNLDPGTAQPLPKKISHV